jgi:hypothetical protein
MPPQAWSNVTAQEPASVRMRSQGATMGQESRGRMGGRLSETQSHGAATSSEPRGSTGSHLSEDAKLGSHHRTGVTWLETLESTCIG